MELETKPVHMPHFAQAFRKALYGDSGEALSRETILALLELHVLDTNPSCYVLGAGEHHPQWQALPEHHAATAHFREVLGEEGNIVRGGVLMYFEEDNYNV